MNSPPPDGPTKRVGSESQTRLTSNVSPGENSCVYEPDAVRRTGVGPRSCRVVKYDWVLLPLRIRFTRKPALFACWELAAHSWISTVPVKEIGTPMERDHVPMDVPKSRAPKARPGAWALWRVPLPFMTGVRDWPSK